MSAAGNRTADWRERRLQRPATSSSWTSPLLCPSSTYTGAGGNAQWRARGTIGPREPAIFPSRRPGIDPPPPPCSYSRHFSRPRARIRYAPTATTPARRSRAGRSCGTSAASTKPRTTTRARNTTCWRCSPTRRGASTWGTCATTPWATCSPASCARAATTCCTRWAGTRSACRPRTPRWSARSRRAPGPTRTSPP